MIVKESNDYFIDNYTTDSGDFGRATYPGEFAYCNGINSTDLLKFIAVNLIAGITKVPEMSNYWSKNSSVHSENISKLMGRLHYEMINASLHIKVDEKEESTVNKISFL